MFYKILKKYGSCYAKQDSFLLFTYFYTAFDDDMRQNTEKNKPRMQPKRSRSVSEVRQHVSGGGDADIVQVGADLHYNE